MNSHIQAHDSDKCKTTHAFGSYYICLNEDAKQCLYSFEFDKDYFCYHPNCGEFHKEDKPNE